MKALDLVSPPFPPGARAHTLAPFPAAYRLLEPVERTLIVDVVTAASFAIERIDALDGVALHELTGRSTMPDGVTPARAARIAFRRLASGQYARQPMPFHAHLLLEEDLPKLEGELRPICADGFAEARDRAAQAAAPKIVSLPGAAPDPELELLHGPNGPAEAPPPKSA